MYSKVHTWIVQVNRRIAVWITSAVGTMACAYFFLFLAILGFPAHGSPPSAYVQWLSQTCIQLVMLSVIMVGQRVMDDKHKDRHDEHMNALDVYRVMHDQLLHDVRTYFQSSPRSGKGKTRRRGRRR